MSRNIQYANEYIQPCNAEYGKLSGLITDELVELCKPKKYIVICGHTKSGKAIIGKILSERLDNRTLIMSDDYKHLGFENAMYHIRELIKKTEGPIIIEGVQSGRILRKGCEKNDFFADLVIQTECNYNSIEYCYIKDGEGNKLRKNQVYNFNYKVLDKIFDDWLFLQRQKYPKLMPMFVKINTSFLP